MNTLHVLASMLSNTQGINIVSIWRVQNIEKFEFKL